MSTYALQSEMEDEFEFEDEATAPGGWGAPVARRAVRAALQGAGSTPAAEFEDEFEFEDEGEWETMINPIRRAYPDALMEHLAHAAAESESEAEAEAFIGALVPLAAQVLPRAASAVMSAAPRLVSGLARVTRTLRRNPATRPLVQAIPTVLRQTTADIARAHAQGRPLTGQLVTRTLARHTANVLQNPRRTAQIVRQARALDRRYHAARGAVRPLPSMAAAAGARPCVCGAGGRQPRRAMPAGRRVPVLR